MKKFTGIIYMQFIKSMTFRKAFAVVFGNIVLGIGAVVGAFFLGPLINFYNRFNKKWIR